MTGLRETLAQRVRDRLASAGVTQADAAAYLGISQKHLSQMLTGAVDGSLSMWDRLLAFVDVSVADSVAPTVDRDTLADEVKYRLRTVAAHAYMRGKQGFEPDTALTQGEVEKMCARLDALLAAGVGGGDVEWGWEYTKAYDGISRPCSTEAEAQRQVAVSPEFRRIVSRRVGPWLPVEGDRDE